MFEFFKKNVNLDGLKKTLENTSNFFSGALGAMIMTSISDDNSFSE